MDNYVKKTKRGVYQNYNNKLKKNKKILKQKEIFLLFRIRR